jgi:hypothetical protein
MIHSHAVMAIINYCHLQLIEALRYKPQGSGFDSRWCYWNFWFTNPFVLTMAPGSTQPRREMSNRIISCEVMTAVASGWHPYHLHVPIVLKSWSVALLGTSGPAQACKGFRYLLILQIYSVKLLHSYSYSYETGSVMLLRSYNYSYVTGCLRFWAAIKKQFFCSDKVFSLPPNRYWLPHTVLFILCTSQNTSIIQYESCINYCCNTGIAFAIYSRRKFNCKAKVTEHLA